MQLTNLIIQQQQHMHTKYILLKLLIKIKIQHLNKDTNKLVDKKEIMKEQK